MTGRRKHAVDVTDARRCCRFALLGLAAVALWACSGCGGRRGQESRGTQARPPAGRAAPPVVTISSADLREAEKVTTAYWQAVVEGKYAEALRYTEAATVAAEQQKAFEQQIKAGMQAPQPTRIASIGPARRDPRSPHNILVPYSIEAKQAIAGEAIVRKMDQAHGWLISGGI